MIDLKNIDINSIKFDKKGRLIQYLGYKINYVNRGNSDLTENEWIKEYNTKGILIPSREYKKRDLYMGRGYRVLDINEKRIDRVIGLEENIFENHDKVCVFKIDLTSTIDEIENIEFRSLMRLFSERLRWNVLLDDRIIGRAYCIECGDNGKVGMHLFIFINIDDYDESNMLLCEKRYRDNVNLILKWFIGMMDQHGGIFRYCIMNVSEILDSYYYPVKRDNISVRNGLRLWLCYICKINDMTRGWYISMPNLRLFETSRYTKDIPRVI